MKPICDKCAVPAQHGDLWAGVPVSKSRYVQGHYRCVLDLLGPELTLKAIQATPPILANIPPDMLVDGQRLPKFARTRPPAFEPTRYLLDEE